MLTLRPANADSRRVKAGKRKITDFECSVRVILIETGTTVKNAGSP